MPKTWDPTSPSPADAMRRLIEGNRRFCDASASTAAQTWGPELAPEVQRPFAVILGCADSRNPVERIFDQCFGDLFVVRIAGNIAPPPIIGSVEFAVSQFGTRLVVVMGHTRCGAIAATVAAVAENAQPVSENIRSITDRITPHIEALVHADGPDVQREAMRANVRASVEHLRSDSRIIHELVRCGRVVVVGAEFDLETGAVNFFDRVAEERAPTPADNRR